MEQGTHEGSGLRDGSRQDQCMTDPAPQLNADDQRRICDALRYLARDLHHRSFAVTSERRELLWEEMDRCLELADRLSEAWVARDDQED